MSNSNKILYELSVIRRENDKIKYLRPDAKAQVTIEYSDQNKTAKDIAKELNRTETSVYLKIKRLALDNNTYNQKHQLPKYLANRKYLDDLKPNSVLDLYAGNKSYYVDKVSNVISNDKNKND